VDGQHDRVHAPNFRPIPLGWVATTGGRPARPGARHDPAVAAGDEHDQVLVDVLPNINVHVVQRDQVHALPLGVEAGRPLSPGFNPIASWTILLGRFLGVGTQWVPSRTPKAYPAQHFRDPADQWSAGATTTTSRTRC